jgi:hypothetical protein
VVVACRQVTGRTRTRRSCPRRANNAASPGRVRSSAATGQGRRGGLVAAAAPPPLPPRSETMRHFKELGGLASLISPIRAKALWATDLDPQYRYSGVGVDLPV